ncbi:MAG: hypothetical protein ABI123_01790 [Ginsengibacter sp.]
MMRKRKLTIHVSAGRQLFIGDYLMNLIRAAWLKPSLNRLVENV